MQSHLSQQIDLRLAPLAIQVQRSTDKRILLMENKVPCRHGFITMYSCVYIDKDFPMAKNLLSANIPTAARDESANVAVVFPPDDPKTNKTPSTKTRTDSKRCFHRRYEFLHHVNQTHHAMRHCHNRRAAGRHPLWGEHGASHKYTPQGTQ
jgi:hypothetical protein